ncbi:MAG: ATP-binding cassette subfamily B protein, partial [Verrucomicrobiales bacterium]
MGAARRFVCESFDLHIGTSSRVCHVSTTLRVLSYLKRYPLLASAQFLCAIVGTLMVIVFPKVTQVILDEVIPNGQVDRLAPLVLLALGAFFLRDFLNAMRILVNNVFEQKVIYDLRSDLYEKIQRLPLRWFDNIPTGDIMTRVSEDVQAMERVLIDGIEQGAVAILQIFIVGFFMFTTNSTLAAASLIPLPFLCIGALLYTWTARDRYRENRKATSDMNSLLHDNIAGIRQIKTYTMEEAEHGRFNKASERVRQTTLRIMRAWASYNPAMSFFGAAGSVIVIWVGGGLALQGEDVLSPGQLVAFLILLVLFYEPISKLHQLNQLIQSGRAAGERVFEILDSEEEANMQDGESLEDVKGHVVYENVSFSYTDRMSTLSGVNLEAKPGQTVALVGPTGAGKSTIINLLTRFYEHDEGRVMIDGRCVSGLKKDGLRKAIGYVTQESFMFNGTVRENLQIADRGADDAALWRVLEIANADAFIKRLPDGLDTNVGERGVKLSVGEKQRVSIARALLKNPPILLLDEATASVDTETERLIQEALER